jgi:two-component system nitrogen regulation response regulator GlnG
VAAFLTHFQGELMARLLVVDDEPNVLYAIKKQLQSDTLDVQVAQTGQQALEMALQFRPDAVILDLRLAGISGMEIFDNLHDLDTRLPVILITGYAATETAIEAMKRGAFDYLLKPLDHQQLRDVVQRALDTSRFRHVPAVFGDETEAEDVDRIIGQCPAMQDMYKAIGRVAPSDVTVLILGESGTGKELVARALFHHSRRTALPFLAINCAALPETLLESELFGHERGAFTGADRRRIGKFEQASGGTLFLDEIGDMSAPVQAKFLRIIQEQRFERLGGNETFQADVRIVAATNKNLEKEVAAGRFREDLLYRLNVFTIRVPPLVERRQDIPLLIDYFLPRFTRDLDRDPVSITPEAQRWLHAYDWPGNVRQLQSVLKSAIVQSSGNLLTLDCIPKSLRSTFRAAGPRLPAPEGLMAILTEYTGNLLRNGEGDIYNHVSMELDRIVFGAVLRHVNGNQVKASELLGISRTTLRTKLRSLKVFINKQFPRESGDM